MTKPVEATSGQATAGRYYNINEYSGQLYKWSVERLSPDNLVCLPIGCLGVLVSLVARVAEGALMLVVNLCIAVKDVVWGQTPLVTAPTANANTNTANPPAAKATGDGKKAKKEEAAPPQKADKKAANTDRTVETDEVGEESEVENEGDVEDTEEETSSADESDDVSSEADSEKTEKGDRKEIPEIKPLDLEKLTDDASEPEGESGDTKTAPSEPKTKQPQPFEVDWNAAEITKRPQWTPLDLSPLNPPTLLSAQSSFLTNKRAIQIGGGAAAIVAATVAGLSLPVIVPLATAGALVAAKPSIFISAWNSLQNLGPSGCRASRDKVRAENLENDIMSVSLPPGAAIKDGKKPKVEDQ